jgi:hypothetical protein
MRAHSRQLRGHLVALVLNERHQQFPLVYGERALTYTTLRSNTGEAEVAHEALTTSIRNAGSVVAGVTFCQPKVNQEDF